MHLKWNQIERRFEAELDRSNFQTDLEAAKAAGFRSDGPPAWVWYSVKAMPLRWLRENRPPMLTIEAGARVEYERLLPVEENNARLKAELAKIKKDLKKKSKQGEKEAPVIRDVDFSKMSDEELLAYIEEGCAVLKEGLIKPLAYVPPRPPDVFCFVCKCPVYDFEYAAGTPNPACLWCQKIILDISDEVC